MSVAEVEKLALNLSEPERARLVANLLHSLPAVLSDPDEGIAEALRRDGELEAGTAKPISLDELDARVKSQRA